MSYVDEVLERVREKNASEPEFLQAVTEVLNSLRPVSYTHLLIGKKSDFLQEERCLEQPELRSCPVKTQRKYTQAVQQQYFVQKTA